MKEIIYKCDGCGKARGEANHWYAAIVLIGQNPRIEIRALGAGHAGGEHFCGQECLFRMIARNLPK